MTYGERVRAERERRGWSRDQLAERIGCSPTTIKNLENSDAAPVGSRFTVPIEHLLGIKADEVDPVDPPISQASDVALIAEMARRLARSGPVTDQANVRSFEIRGVPLSGEQGDGAS